MAGIISLIALVTYSIPVIWFNFTRSQFKSIKDAKFSGVENVVYGYKMSKTYYKLYKTLRILINIGSFMGILSTLAVLVWYIPVNGVSNSSVGYFLAVYVVSTLVIYSISWKEWKLLNNLIKY